LVTAAVLTKDKDKNRQVGPASWFADFARVADSGPKERRSGAKEAKADKPKGYEPDCTLQEFPSGCRTFAGGVTPAIQQNIGVGAGRKRLRFRGKRRNLAAAMTRLGAGIRTA
jgi:hypothetical protein